ncbi:MAG: UPF0262 family protein [Pseudomonadota bacterium]
MADNRLISVEIDEASLGANGPDVEHERRVAIFDLLEANVFALIGHDAGGPYRLILSEVDRKLVFDIRDEVSAPVYSYIFSLSPFRGVIRDYFMICESYHEAIRGSTPMQIEAIDMARRGIHNEGSDLLRERLQDKIDIDINTSRRLFTLICALHSATKGPTA